MKLYSAKINTVAFRLDDVKVMSALTTFLAGLTVFARKLLLFPRFYCSFVTCFHFCFMLCMQLQIYDV